MKNAKQNAWWRCFTTDSGILVGWKHWSEKMTAVAALTQPRSRSGRPQLHAHNCVKDLALILPRDTYALRGLCRGKMSVRPSHAGIVCKRWYISSKFFSPSGSPTILVFPYQTGRQYSDGDPLTGAPNARGIKNHDLRPISGFISQLMQDRAIHSYYGRRIGNRTQAFQWYHFEWLEWPLTQSSRSWYHSTSNNSKTVQDRAKFTMADQWCYNSVTVISTLSIILIIWYYQMLPKSKTLAL